MKRFFMKQAMGMASFTPAAERGNRRKVAK
jgi:hypothetical protein